MASSQITYHPIGKDGEPWPEWLVALKKQCGVYVIRDRRTHHALYVGSSKARLYDTVTRHFQRWKRKKNWWKGLHGAHHDPGMTYDRSDCEVGIKITSCGEHLEEEGRLIQRLRPRDNITQDPAGEDVPF